ncbi:DMT family protein [Frankia sp. CcWB2]
MLATAVGLLSAIQAALTSSIGHLLTTRGIDAVLVSWQPWSVVATAIVGALLLQSAYEMAPLPASLPAAVSSEPLAGVVIGVALLGGDLRLAPLALVGEVLGLAVMVTGVRTLATSPLITGQMSRLVARQAQGRLSRLEEQVHHDLERLRADLRRSRRAGVPGPALRRARRRLRRDLDRIGAELASLVDERHRFDDRMRPVAGRVGSNGPRPSNGSRPRERGLLGDDAVPERELLAARRALDTRADELRRRADRLRGEAGAVLAQRNHSR